jgi:peptide/nickel transport system substrate-binding protein
MDWPNPNPIGSGPYQLTEWKKGEYFRFTANKDHFIAPKFDGLYCIVNPTIEGLMAMLERGDAEILGWFIDAKKADQLDAMPHLRRVGAPNHGMHEIRPNLKLKPMNDPKFRQAFQHLVNRRVMLDVIYGGAGTVCHNTPITSLIKTWNNPEIPIIEFDPEKAREILKAAGYTWDAQGRMYYP